MYMDEFNLTSFESLITENKVEDELDKPIELSQSEYASLFENLQNMFQNAYELTEILESAHVLRTPEELQMSYTESVIEEAILNAILESYENGPIYESVDRADKEVVKNLVRNLRPKIQDYLANNKIHFYKTNIIAQLLLGTAGLAGGAALGAGAAKAIGTGAMKMAGGVVASKSIPLVGKMVGNMVANGAKGAVVKGAIGAAGGAAVAGSGINTFKGTFQQLFSTHIWQTLGIVHIEEGNIGDLCNRLNIKFADDLQKYKIIYFKAIKTIYDKFKTHFGWKDQRQAYFLLIDSRLPEDLKKLSDNDESEYTDVVDK